MVQSFQSEDVLDTLEEFAVDDKEESKANRDLD